MDDDKPYRRKRGVVSYRLPGNGVQINEATSGPDAPYGSRDARLWWGFVAVLLALAVVLGAAALLAG